MAVFYVGEKLFYKYLRAGLDICRFNRIILIRAAKTGGSERIEPVPAPT